METVENIFSNSDTICITVKKKVFNRVDIASGFCNWTK